VNCAQNSEDKSELSLESRSFVSFNYVTNVPDGTIIYDAYVMYVKDIYCFKYNQVICACIT